MVPRFTGIATQHSVVSVRRHPHIRYIGRWRSCCGRGSRKPAKSMGDKIWHEGRYAGCVRVSAGPPLCSCITCIGDAERLRPVPRIPVRSINDTTPCDQNAVVTIRFSNLHADDPDYPNIMLSITHGFSCISRRCAKRSCQVSPALHWAHCRRLGAGRVASLGALFVPGVALVVSITIHLSVDTVWGYRRPFEESQGISMSWLRSTAHVVGNSSESNCHTKNGAIDTYVRASADYNTRRRSRSRVRQVLNAAPVSMENSYMQRPARSTPVEHIVSVACPSRSWRSG